LNANVIESMTLKTELKWFHKAVVYQIYPRSFYDSNGDGIGDLKGITLKLDYLARLGIGAIWLSPFFTSPMADFGYDVSDYCDVDPIFGNILDFDELIKEAHARNIKVMVDYVPNHTSDKHPWFLESKSSRDNPKRDWYLWKDAKPDGSLPNNWLSLFGGTGWELDETTNSYYYHSFLKEQPDLNWRNPEVEKAMKDVLRFWLDKGVDGFRMDAVYCMFKDFNYEDNPVNPEYVLGTMDPYHAYLNVKNFGLPETLDALKEFADVLGDYQDRFMVTEVYLPIPELIPFFKVSSAKIHSPFNMNLIMLPWGKEFYKTMIEDLENNITLLDVPNYVLGNHDRPRVATRVGKDRAKLLTLMQLTLRGMPFVYYGDELGMEDVYIPVDEVQDPFEKNVPGMGLGRDPIRTPFQWSPEPFAGFSTVKPWLRVSDDFEKNNVEVEERDKSSMLYFYKTLLGFRSITPSLWSTAEYKPLDVSNPNVYVYERGEKEKVIVMLNFSPEPQGVNVEGEGELVLSTYMDKTKEKVSLSGVLLRPYEGLLFVI
jgi:alpha-glucosidase